MAQIGNLIVDVSLVPIRPGASRTLGAALCIVLVRPLQGKAILT